MKPFSQTLHIIIPTIVLYRTSSASFYAFEKGSRIKLRQTLLALYFAKLLNENDLNCRSVLIWTFFSIPLHVAQEKPRTRVSRATSLAATNRSTWKVICWSTKPGSMDGRPKSDWVTHAPYIFLCDSGSLGMSDWPSLHPLNYMQFCHHIVWSYFRHVYC
jgi:hypothetical protein